MGKVTRKDFYPELNGAESTPLISPISTRCFPQAGNNEQRPVWSHHHTGARELVTQLWPILLVSPKLCPRKRWERKLES